MGASSTLVMVMILLVGGGGLRLLESSRRHLVCVRLDRELRQHSREEIGH